MPAFFISLTRGAIFIKLGLAPAMFMTFIRLCVMAFRINSIKNYQLAFCNDKFNLNMFMVVAFTRLRPLSHINDFPKVFFHLFYYPKKQLRHLTCLSADRLTQLLNVLEIKSDAVPNSKADRIFLILF